MESSHVAALVSWNADGTELATPRPEVVPDALAHRAWRCSCGWSGEVREVGEGFYRPRGDVDGRLRTIRVRRSDRDAFLEWRAHVDGTSTDRSGASAESLPAAALDSPRTDPAASDPIPDRPTVVGRGSPAMPVSARARRARERALADRGGHLALARGAATDAVEAGSVDGSTTCEHPRPAPDPGESGVEVATVGLATGPSHGDQVADTARLLAQARNAVADLERALINQVKDARAAGLSWRAIARATGTDHLTARDRWGS